MFIIFNKEKIKSYLTVTGIVIMLFGIAISTETINNNTIETNSNTIENMNLIDLYNE